MTFLIQIPSGVPNEIPDDIPNEIPNAIKQKRLIFNDFGIGSFKLGAPVCYKEKAPSIENL